MKGTRGRQRERERRESTQRLGRSEGDTIENNDNEKGGGVQRWRGAKAGGGDADTRSRTYHLKETFIPHIKGGSRDELS